MEVSRKNLGVFVDRPVLYDALRTFHNALMVVKPLREKIDLEIERPAVHVFIKIGKVGVVFDRFVERFPAVMLAEHPGEGRFS